MRAVRYLQQHLEPWKVTANLLQDRRETRVEDEPSGLRVSQEIPQLLGAIAVVDIEGRDSSVERSKHRLEILISVMEADPEMVLAGLIWPEVLPRHNVAQPALVEGLGKLPSSGAELAIGELVVAADEAEAVRVPRFNSLEDPRNVEVHHSPNGFDTVMTDVV